MRTTAMLAGAAVAMLAACSGSDVPVAEDARLASPHSLFFANLKSVCGKAFEGRVVSSDPQDDDMRAVRLVMHGAECGQDVMRIPFHVGENRSRTWVISRTEAGLRLKHDHRHEDGSEDAVTQYGGDTATEGTATRQEFPVDAFSIALFEREGLAASVTNVWALEITPDKSFVYELARENRLFRVEFDLTAPVAAPPPPWGATLQ